MRGTGVRTRADDKADGGRAKRGWATTLAGLLLVVQAALLAFSLGASAAPTLRDQFGNVLCSADEAGQHGAPSEPGDRHHGRLDCCTAGCPMSGGGVAPASSLVMPARHAFAASRPLFALRENAAGAGVPPSPRSARAPPVPV